MSDFLGSGAFTWFDLIVVTIMVISGLMALARGFIREIASIFAFVLALFAAFMAWRMFAPTARSYLPENWSDWIADALVVGIAFLAIYIITAWLGRKISKFVHIHTDIGLFDRLAGLVFGVARGAAVVVLVLLATRPFIEEAQIRWIVDAYTYPYFVDAVIWVQSNFMVFSEGVQEAIPVEITESP